MDEHHAPHVARYRLRRPLGVGGLGVVYAADDPELGREVAIKLIRLRSTKSQGFERLRREASALARVSDPNVVGVFDVGRYDVRRHDMTRRSSWPEDVPRVGVYVVMELVHGTDLRRWLGTPHDRQTVLSVFAQAGRGLAAAHAAGVVHRDFKPANVLVDDDGQVKVIDFGLAQWLQMDPTTSTFEDDAPPEPSRSESMTMTGMVMGTPAYMAPEQHRGDPSSERTDQYAFCIALAEALCGARPFAGTTLEDLHEAKHQRRLDPRMSEIPPRLRGVIQRGLALDPAERWHSMTELLEHLDGSRGRLRWTLAGGALAALGFAGWLLPASDADPTEPPPPDSELAPVSAIEGLRPSLEAESLRREAEDLWIGRRPTAELRAALERVAPGDEAPEDPSLAAEVLLWRGRLEEEEAAAELYRRAFFLARDADVPSIAARAAMAMTTVEIGDHGQALTEWTRHGWVEVERGAWDREAAIDVAVTSAGGRAFAFYDEYTKDALEFAGTIIGEIQPSDGVFVASKVLDLSSAWRYVDVPERALYWARVGRALVDATVGPDHILHVQADEALGLAIEELDRCDEAIVPLERALAGYTRANDGALDLDGALLGFHIADCLEFMDRPEAALDLYERMLEYFRSHEDAFGGRRSQAHLGAARLLAQLGRIEEARAQYEQAIAMVDLSAPSESNRQDAREELAALDAKTASRQ